MFRWFTRFLGKIQPSAAAPGAAEGAGISQTPLDRYRELIDRFDEDREGLGAKIVRKTFTFAAYAFPFLIASFVGKEIGDYYSGPFNPADGWSGGMHIVAWLGEAALAMMVISTAAAWRHYKADPGYTPKLLASGITFLVFTLESCFAQWVIAYNHIRPHLLSDYAALVFRVGMAPCVDIASLLFLSIMGYKSLKQYLGEMQQKAQAIRLLNEAEIAIKDAQQDAERRSEQATQYLEGQKAWQGLILEISRINGQATIELAKAALTQGGKLQLLPPEREAGVPGHNSAHASSFPNP
jgi:hypothetical protein